MAHKYYGDKSLWWVIAVANNNVTKGSIFPIPGTQLRIPSNIGKILGDLEKIIKVPVFTLKDFFEK